MEFKIGDKVHVTRLEGKEVDFFTTLQYANLPGLHQMVDSTDSNYNECFLWKSNQRSFGPDEKDYYTLATDEEDSELLTIEHDELIKDIEKLKEEKAAIEMYLDAVKVYKPMYEEVNRKYNKLTEHIRLKALHNPSISRYIDLVCFINDMEDK